MPSTINADNGVSSGSAGLKSTADSSGVLSLQTNGTTAVTVDTSQNVGIGTSSPGGRLDVSSANDIPMFFRNATATIRLRPYVTSYATSQIAAVNAAGSAYTPLAIGGSYTTIETNGIEQVRIDSSGNLLLGLTGGTGRLRVLGADSTSANYSIVSYNSAGTSLFYTRNDGLFNTGSASASPYNNTTASAANIFVDSGGNLFRSTSSLRYKTNVQDATYGLADVLKLRPVTYQGKNDGDTVFGGLIAEEVHEAGLTQFVTYDSQGRPDALAYGNMVSVLIKAIQELKAEVDSLKSQLAAKG